MIFAKVWIKRHLEIQELIHINNLRDGFNWGYFHSDVSSKSSFVDFRNKNQTEYCFSSNVFFSQVAAIWTPRSSSDELFVKMGKTKRRTKKVRLPLTIYLCIFWCEVRLQCTYIGCKTLKSTKVILSKTHCSSETCGVLSKYLHWLQNLGTNQWNNFKNYFIMLKIQA